MSENTSPTQHATYPIEAVCTLQVWNDLNYAIDVKEVTFDAFDALECLPFDELPADGDFSRCYRCCYGNEVWYEAMRLGLVEVWTGPFHLSISDADAYSRYYAERKANGGKPIADY